MSKLKLTGAWDPTNISGLIMWHDADNPDNVINTTTSDTFAEVKDKSTNNNHLTQTTKVEQPDVVTVGSRKFLDTNATTQRMWFADQTVLTSLNNMTMVFVVDAATTTIWMPYVIGYEQSTGADQHYMLPMVRLDDWAGYSVFFNLYDSASYPYNYIGSSTDVRNTKFVATLICTDSEYIFRINGVDSAAVVLAGANDGECTASLHDTPDGMNLGQQYRSNVPNFVYAHFGDLMYYNTNLEISECSKIENYLMTKHSIT